MSEQLIYDSPKCEGVANAIRRARQFLQVSWKPVMELEINEKNFIHSTRSGRKHEAEESFRSMPYSSARVKDKFVGLELSMDTFLTALQNPASVLYTRELADFEEEAFNCTITNTYLYYGVVCSSFVNYVLDLPIHRSTREWDIAPEFYRIENQSADGLELCDTLVTTRPDGRSGGHVRIVTGLARDLEGHVKKVEISEGETPAAKCNWFTAEEFEATLTDPEKRYQIYRCKDLERIAYKPCRIEEGYEPGTELMLDYGDFSVYNDEETISFHINCEAEMLILESGDERAVYDVHDVMPTLVLGQPCKLFKVSGLAPGTYTAYCTRQGEKTLSVHFIVAKLPDVTLTLEDGREPERVELIPVTLEGERLTRKSPCFFREDGSLNTGIVKIALKCEEKLIPARAAIREKDGKLVMRLAAMLTDETGEPVNAFDVEADMRLYAYRLREGDAYKAQFSGAEACVPHSYAWKEEAAIAYDQGLVNGTVCSKVRYYENAFGHFSLFCKNEYGTITTRPIAVLIEQA